MAWNKSAVTNDGVAMLNELLAGRTLTVTQAVGGTGVSDKADLPALTGLVEQKQVLKLLGVESLEKGKKVNIQITSKDLAETYIMNQIGVFAQLDGEDAAKLLFILQNDVGVEIPAESVTPDFGIEFYAVVQIDNNAQMQIIVDTSAWLSLAGFNRGMEEHNADPNAHPDIRKLIEEGGGSGGSSNILGKGAPTEDTEAEVKQFYIDTDTGTTYVCTAVSDEGKTTWIKTGATSADQIDYGDGTLADALDAMAEDMEKLGEAVAGSVPLSGPDDPMETTKGAVGQKYLNTTTGEEFTCMAVNDDGTYTWGQPSNTGGGGSSLTLDRIYIDTPPTKTAYKAGETFDPAGMVVKADYAMDGVVITQGISVTGYSYPTAPLKTTDTEVTITYSEGGEVKTATVAVTVTKTSVTIPTYTGSLTYNGQEQTPSFNNNNSTYMTAGGDLSATNAGSYAATFALKSAEYYEWADGTTEVKSVAWSIAKATPALSVSPTSVTLDPDHLTATANVTTNGDGALSVQSGDTGIATASIADKVVTVSHVNKATGSTEVTISQAATDNYNAASVKLPVAARFITLTITVDSGSAVTVQNGSTTLNGTSTGTVKFYLPNTGTWTATATLGDETATGSINITAYQDYTLELSYVKVFGVSWNSTNTSTALTRLTKASDPESLVNVDITTEPVPAVGTGAGSSPFDAYAPWSGMEEYNIISNAVSYKKGESGFSRTGNDTMVYIPEFYFKIVDDGTTRRFYVADKAKTGFTKHPGSGKYVGRYNTISGYYSKSGAAPLVNITRAVARTGSKGKGDKWSQYDFASWCAVQLLFLVEFADWDSQTVVGKGNVNTSAALSTGGTDSMAYHTGRAAGTDGQVQVQYRGIEDPWGNVFEWIDGANFSERAAYICTNPANYADDTATNYTAAGVTLPSSGWTKGLGMSTAFPWAYLPDEAGGSETTYIPDYVYSSTGWRVLMVGGGYGSTSSAGLWYFYASNTSSSASASIGARLLYHP